MAGRGAKDIARADWDDLEHRLRRRARGGTRSPTGDRELRDYFGDAALAELQDLAERAAAARSRAPVLGNVVLIPGIMGSSLSCVEKRDETVVWVSLFRIALGGLGNLRLGPDGEREVKPGVTVSASAVDKRTYARAVLRLRARWNVEPFPFDWRKDVDRASEALATLIRTRFRGEPVHLVAHSMGGLVARNFIRQRKAVWEKMRDDGGRGGRLVMLGTPNFGSFAIPQVLTGVEKLAVWLARLDLSHSLADLLEIIDGFVGSYQMLPAPDMIPESMRAIYRRDVWGRFPVSERHLARGRAFHEALQDAATIDPSRMIYIAGCNRRTLSGLQIIAPGEFSYTETLDGDGRVTHQLGMLPGVPTYYADEDHGGLPQNAQVLNAVDEILERGATSLLPEQPPAARAPVTAGGRWYRAIEEHRTGVALEEIARRARDDDITPEEQRLAEETVLRAAVGEGRPAREAAEAGEQLVQQRMRTAGPRRRLEVEVVWGDAAKVAAPVVVVGQYQGVHPVRKSALGAIDAALDGFIDQAITSGLVGSGLGQLFFIPIDRRQIAARTVVLAGMGAEGRFSQEDLRYLMLNVASGVTGLGVERFATVMIGAGAGNLSEDHALRGMLFGICEAMARLPGSRRLRRVLLIEKDRGRFDRIVQKLEGLAHEGPAAALDIVLARPRTHAGGRRHAKPQPGPVPTPFGPRITIERAGDVFRFSALTETAVVPVREVEIQSFFPDGIAERLVMSTGKKEQERLGRLLTTTLVPEDFVDHLDSPDPVTFILDRSTAAIPWEMGSLPTRRGERAFLGSELALTRQFRTRLASAPGIAPPANEILRVLVIADPAPEPDYQLPGARLEGRAVVETLCRIKTEYGLDIDVIDRIGDAECEPVDILGLILEGGFDLIHYAGHGVFDERNPAAGGWVFGKDRVLSSREIFRARRVPRVIVANACFSAVVNPGMPLTPAETNRQLAGIAEAFFERGVQNYIGAGWPVQDDVAVEFATTFYEIALVGRRLVPPPKRRDTARPAKRTQPAASPCTIGDALREARRVILHRGSTWGAYQHYGQATDWLIKLPPAG
jgi:pimeloyl-ACP methyl ester carboxylesterase